MTQNRRIVVQPRGAVNPPSSPRRRCEGVVPPPGWRAFVGRPGVFPARPGAAPGGFGRVSRWERGRRTSCAGGYASSAIGSRSATYWGRPVMSVIVTCEVSMPNAW